MGQVFGSHKKKPAITEIDKAVLTLKTQRRKLEDYQKRVRSSPAARLNAWDEQEVRTEDFHRPRAVWNVIFMLS